MTSMPNASESALIKVDRNREQLRDYFLRLGADARIDPTGDVRVRLAADDDVTLREYLSSWSSINQIHAHIA